MLLGFVTCLDFKYNNTKGFSRGGKCICFFVYKANF